MNKIKKFVEWLKNPCTRGNHNNRVIRKGRCQSYYTHTPFSTPVKTLCEVEVRECQDCGKKVAWMSNGMVATTRMDPDFVIRRLDEAPTYSS